MPDELAESATEMQGNAYADRDCHSSADTDRDFYVYANTDRYPQRDPDALTVGDPRPSVERCIARV